ncbi:MAG: sigma-54 dependent transcriptional regulator, partial [Nitrospinaceae bacterium]
MSLILVVDDEKSLREFLTIMLENDGYEVKTAGSGEDAVKQIRENAFDLVITDIRMKNSSGIDVLEAARDTNPNIPVIMMTAYASAETAVEAMKKGAYDYISKPFKIEDLQLIVKNAVEKKKLSDENIYLKSELEHKYGLDNIIGKSPAIERVFGLIRKVASSNATILLTGESGTGKELAARAIHYNGTRRNYPFVSVNCGAMPETLLESELFGHEKGAFTSADSAKVGLMETAQKGSFFLDEIGEAPMSIQVKLLRVLQEREFTRVGGTKTTKVDIRFIAASNIDLTEAVRNKTFREDLFYRLNVIPVHLPSMRERREDIPLLVDFFLNKYNGEHQNKSPIEGIHSSALAVLERYHWPGNVRELENVI